MLKNQPAIVKVLSEINQKIAWIALSFEISQKCTKYVFVQTIKGYTVPTYWCQPMVTLSKTESSKTYHQNHRFCKKKTIKIAKMQKLRSHPMLASGYFYKSVLFRQ